ncbi:major facilitator superfamily MFS_1, partial [mine drainage metagenome]
PAVLLVRTVGWLGRGARGPMRDYLISRSVDRSAYGRAYGFREALDTLGALLGPVAAFLLLQRFGYRPLILWTAVPGLLGVVAIIVFVRDLPKAPDPEERSDIDLRIVSRMFARRLRSFLVFSIAYVAPTFFILRATQILHAHASLLGASAAAVGL